jgi:simple sugar transport system ATP-binding protein
MQPCKGLDIGAIEFVQNKLVEQRDKGLAILYISTELEHILEIADRIAVLCRGRITGIVPPEQATAERIGMLMGGLTEESAA